MLEDYQIYDTAAQVDDKELFEYGMETNVGYAFVYGELKTLDPVSYPEVSGKYSYIKKEEQEYRKHYRYVEEEYKDSKGKKHTRKKKEEYWTWDTMRTDSKTATKISFLDVEFVYYGTDTDFQGTIFTSLKENTINDTKFYKNQTISETIESLEAGIELIIFWILWILLTIGLVIGFYYFDNKWLKKN